MASPNSPSLQPSRSASVSDSADHLSTNGIWSEEQETRLQHCQAELEKAQKRWSASQDLWIEEYRRLQDCEKQVDLLLGLKKAHLKALKKQQVQAKKAVGIWKKRTWKGLSRTSSKVDTTSATPPDDDADDEGGQDEQDEEEDSLDQIERTDSMQNLALIATASIAPCHLEAVSSAPTSKPLQLTKTFPHKLPPTTPTTPLETSSRRSSIGKAVRRLNIAGIRGKRKPSTANSSAGPSATPSALPTPTTVSKSFFE